jgi:type IV secretion system protein VirD4
MWTLKTGTAPKQGDPVSGGLVIEVKKKGRRKEEFSYLQEDVHSLIIGATRSGKSRSIVLQTVALTGLAGESMVITDPKGELSAYCQPFLKRLDYEVICIDFKDPLKSHRYNFLQPVIDAVKKGDTAKAVDLTWDITASLVGEPKGERIWTDGEASVIAGTNMSVDFDNWDSPQYQNLTNVYYFLLNMCRLEDMPKKQGAEAEKKEKPKDMLVNLYLEELPDDHPAKGLFGIAQIAPSRTRGSFFTAALATLRLFTAENIFSQTCASDFTLADTGSKKRVIFILLPDQKTTFYTLASLFVYQHYLALTETADARGGRLKNRVNFILDEFGNFTKIPNFSNILTVGGGRGCRFNLFVQAFSQLEEKYGREQSATIVTNCHCWIYLKTADTETAEKLERKLGQYTTSSYSRSSSYGHSSSGSASQSVNLIARPLFTKDEIVRINRPYALVMMAGQYPAVTELPDISLLRFNTVLGLGTPEHNAKVRFYREQARPARQGEKIRLWGIWEKYKEGGAAKGTQAGKTRQTGWASKGRDVSRIRVIPNGQKKSRLLSKAEQELLRKKHVRGLSLKPGGRRRKADGREEGLAAAILSEALPDGAVEGPQFRLPERTVVQRFFFGLGIALQKLRVWGKGWQKELAAANPAPEPAVAPDGGGGDVLIDSPGPQTEGFLRRSEVRPRAGGAYRLLQPEALTAEEKERIELL